MRSAPGDRRSRRAVAPNAEPTGHLARSRLGRSGHSRRFLVAHTFVGMARTPLMQEIERAAAQAAAPTRRDLLKRAGAAGAAVALGSMARGLPGARAATAPSSKSHFGACRSRRWRSRSGRRRRSAEGPPARCRLPWIGGAPAGRRECSFQARLSHKSQAPGARRPRWDDGAQSRPNRPQRWDGTSISVRIRISPPTAQKHCATASRRQATVACGAASGMKPHQSPSIEQCGGMVKEALRRIQAVHVAAECTRFEEGPRRGRNPRSCPVLGRLKRHVSIGELKRVELIMHVLWPFQRIQDNPRCRELWSCLKHTEGPSASSGRPRP
jgi:hypothetical protein